MPAEAVSVLDGATFVVGDRTGDLDPRSRHPPHGFFFEDTRFVSTWRLSIGGRRAELLSTAQVDHFASQFFLVPPTKAFHGAPAMSIIRHRLVTDLWMEELLILNNGEEPTTVAIELDVEADFADLFDVKDDRIEPRLVVARARDHELSLRYRNGRFVRETQIAVEAGDAKVEIEADSIRVGVSLPARGERVVTFVVTPHAEQEGLVARPTRPTGTLADLCAEQRREVDAWLSAAPTLVGGADALQHVYAQSLDDLGALRFQPHLEGVGAVPAAGLPWFMTLFGRDAIIASHQALPFLPQLAHSTLRTLAARQGTEVDDFRDEEPGKILHEVRFGEQAATRAAPHSPYYGTADATPLFVVLLDEYTSWTGDMSLAVELEPHARAALEWIDASGDLDGDGYIEYRTRNPRSGLVNQCWKDSWNSMLFADGRVAPVPIASCEIQGYAYDAKLRGARLAREVWRDEALAARLEHDAQLLKRRFNTDFWMEQRGCFALALDGAKRQVDSITSNIGHLLWSGIVDEDRSDAVVAHLMGEALWSGWGVRTMAMGEAGYNPVEYHNGTVWPHDNSLIASGLRRYGYRDEAGRIAGAVVEASAFFGHRLPEVFAGYGRSISSTPVVYPTASSPQAWAAGSPLLLLTTVLGLTVRDGTLRCDPHVPPELGEFSLNGMRGRWGEADVDGRAGAVDCAVGPRR